MASEEDEALSSQPIISTLPPQTEKEKVTLIPTSDGEESRVKPINETSSFGNQLWNASVNGSEFPTMSDRPVWLYANGSSVQLNSTYTTILPNTSQLDNVSTSTWQKPLEIEYTTAVATTDTTNPSITSPLPGDSSGTTSITTQSTEVPTEDDHSTHTPITETFTIGEKETVSSQPSVTESTTPEEAIGIQELKLSTEVGNSSIATSASSNSDIPEKSSTIQATTHQSYSNAEAPLQQTEMNSTTQGAVLSELHVSTDQSSQLSSQVSNSPGESEDSQWNISSTIEHDGSSVEPNRLSSDEESIDLDASEPDFPCPETPNVKIYPGQLCNGEVDCPRATDERNCTCEKRIHRSRICDGVIDCPSMQDEIGCRGKRYYFST